MKLYKVLLGVLFFSGSVCAMASFSELTEEDRNQRACNLGLTRAMVVDPDFNFEEYEQDALVAFNTMLKSAHSTLSLIRKELLVKRWQGRISKAITSVIGVSLGHGIWCALQKWGPKFFANTEESVPGGAFALIAIPVLTDFFQAEIEGDRTYGPTFKALDLEIQTYANVIQKIEQKLEQAS